MKRASPADLPADASSGDRHVIRDNRPARGWSLWLWVAAGFLFLAVLWTALFVVARSAEIRSVPLATKEAKP